jgi:hypothetical protein
MSRKFKEKKKHKHVTHDKLVPEKFSCRKPSIPVQVCLPHIAHRLPSESNSGLCGVSTSANCLKYGTALCFLGIANRR